MSTDARALRARVPFALHAVWEAQAWRGDPIELLETQSAQRLPSLVPIRYGRMAASPLSFLRGSAVVMAADLAELPVTGIRVQACGDAHLANFGLFASPERSLLFGVNDFDETLPAPWEWDVKRLAVSFVLLALEMQLRRHDAAGAARAAARAYRERLRAYARMTELAVWYARIGADDVLGLLRGAERRAERRMAAKSWHHDNFHAAPRLTVGRAGRRRMLEAPPLLTHETVDLDAAKGLFASYRDTLLADRRALLDRFHVADAALKVVGIGSVGTRCLVVLLEGDRTREPLFLQVKEATGSALEPYAGTSTARSDGERVVIGQRLIQSAPDIFLGWSHDDPSGRDFYWRQLRDMKGAFDPRLLTARGLATYAGACGWALARAHARASPPEAIAAYLGSGAGFDGAIAAFAEAYADQVERDHATLVEAIAAGRIRATEGV